MRAKPWVVFAVSVLPYMFLLNWRKVINYNDHHHLHHHHHYHDDGDKDDNANDYQEKKGGCGPLGSTPKSTSSGKTMW